MLSGTYLSPASPPRGVTPRGKKKTSHQSSGGKTHSIELGIAPRRQQDTSMRHHVMSEERPTDRNSREGRGGESTGGRPEGSGSRGGRPKKNPEDRRTISHGLYLSPKEKEKLEKRAERAGLSINAYVRKKALGKPVKPRVEKNLINELNQIGASARRLAQWASERQDRAVKAKIDALIEDLSAAIEKLHA